MFLEFMRSKINGVIAKRTSQIMKYGQNVIIQKRTDDNIQFGKWYKVLQIESTYPASCMTPASVNSM